MYMAPEIGLDGRRGKAVDIFSLGCIFLETSTCVIAGPGARAKSANCRDVNGPRTFLRLSQPDYPMDLVPLGLLY